MILQVFSILYMVASFFVCLGFGYEWSYSEDRSFWNKRLLRAVLIVAFAVITNILLFHFVK